MKNLRGGNRGAWSKIWSGVFAVIFMLATGTVSSEELPLPEEPLTLETALKYSNSQPVASVLLEVNLGVQRQSNLVGSLMQQDLQSGAVLFDSPELESSENLISLLDQDRRLIIAQLFFDVLLSDYDYAINNEQMTLEFLQFDRNRKRAELLDNKSEVQLLELESEYLDAFTHRERAAVNQLGTRIRLGIAMGFDDYVPRDVIAPDLSEFAERESPDLHDLTAVVLESNTELAAIREAHQAAASMEGPDAEQETAKIQNALWTSEANLRIEVFELWEELQFLQVARRAIETKDQFRSQYMDHSRSLFEFDLPSDRGSAQVELFRVQREIHKIAFQTAMVWSRLDALMGKQVFSNDS